MEGLLLSYRQQQCLMAWFSGRILMGQWGGGGVRSRRDDCWGEGRAQMRDCFLALHSLCRDTLQNTCEPSRKNLCQQISKVILKT